MTHYIFLDISSTCSGFTIAEIYNDRAHIVETGAIWRPHSWEKHGQYYKYLIDFLVDKFEKTDNISLVVFERYFLSPNKGHGVSVVSEAIGAVKASCHYPQTPIKYDGIPPPSWRSALGIKKDHTQKGSNQYKVPTKVKIEELLNITFPEKITDTFTGKRRNLPTDLVDSIGVCMGYLRKEKNIHDITIKEDLLSSL